MRTGLLLALAAAFGAAAPAVAQDAAAGRAKAQQVCAVCHGMQGIAVHPEAPHLAGQPVFYLAAQLKHYRNGTRHHEVMNVIAKPLSDAEIDNLAAWFSSIKVEGQAPH